MFWGRNFLVNADVLDPRPETEVLVSAASEELYRRVLDLGTGSGCLLVTLLAEQTASSGIGVDLSASALQVAGRNAALHGVADRANFIHSDWFSAVEGQFDLIVSNPPYIAAPEVPSLEPEVRDWEPRMALTDEADGLEAYRFILARAQAHLAPGGRLLLEHGPTQAEELAGLGRLHGFPPPEHRLDLDGRRRACLFRAS
jgi:release factor glutamine methyltransferase